MSDEHPLKSTHNLSANFRKKAYLEKIRGIYVKSYFALSRLLVSDFLLSNVLFWSSVKYMFLKNNKENWIHTVCHMREDFF